MPLVTHMPKITLFLGAGASKAFDYPATKEFVDNLYEVLTDREKRILNSFLKTPNVSDIEHVLQIIDTVIDFDSMTYINKLFRGQAAFSASIEGMSFRWQGFVEICKDLKKKIISELHRQYEFDENKLKNIVENYDGLFKSIFIDPESMQAKVGQIHVFTTNYDSIIENYCVKKQINFTCGFELERLSGRQFWKPKVFKKYNRLMLYKLHGSLDWRETNDGRIERVTTEEQVSKITRKHKRNILIYTTQKEYLTEEPFRTLMNYFEDILNKHDACLVVGFSFRDPYINRIFLGFLRANPNRKLVVVSPSASKNVEEKLLQGDKKLKKQIICLDMLFGDKKTLDQIRREIIH